MLAIPDLREPLSDGAVALRLAAERDIPEILIAHQDDSSLHRRLGLERPPSGAELGRMVERAEAERAEGAGVTLTILEPDGDECRGQAFVCHVESDHARAELGIWVAPRVRRRGIARRALGLTGGWLLGACGLQRVQMLSETDNEPLIRAACGAGFRCEGVLRGHERRGQRRIDLAVLSLLPRDLEPMGE